MRSNDGWGPYLLGAGMFPDAKTTQPVRPAIQHDEQIPVAAIHEARQNRQARLMRFSHPVVTEPQAKPN